MTKNIINISFHTSDFFAPANDNDIVNDKRVYDIGLIYGLIKNGNTSQYPKDTSNMKRSINGLNFCKPFNRFFASRRLKNCLLTELRCP